MHYSKVGVAKELSSQKDRMTFRFFEMLPGISVWSTFGLLFFLSWQKPVWVAVFVIVFDLYWFFRTIYFSFYAYSAHRKMKKAMNKNWRKELEALASSQYTLSVPSWRDIYHLVIIPMLNEPYEVVYETFHALYEMDYPKERMIVVLALEESGGRESEEVGRKIERKFGGAFGHFFITVHPKDIKGEIAGKGSNEAWAARQVKEEHIDPRAIPYENIIVSTFDVDTVISPQYFSCVTYTFLQTENPTRASFQPVSLFTNNIWDAPSISRLLAFSTTLLPVCITHRLPKRRGHVRIHSHRIIKGNHSIIPIIVQKTLPENTGILRHHVYLPKINVHKSPKTHGMTGKSYEPFTPLLIQRLPKSR